MTLEGVFRVGDYCPMCGNMALSLNNEYKPIRLIQCDTCGFLYQLTQYRKVGL